MFERIDCRSTLAESVCAAYLFRPAPTSAGSVPCVVVGHGASGTTANLFPIADSFPAAGLNVLHCGVHRSVAGT
jgi:dienelactone hydrolase